MSQNYVDKKIEEALALHKGNAARARQQLITWAATDPALLLGLTKGHLTGIVAYAVAKAQQKQVAPTYVRQTSQTAKRIDMAPETFGKDLLKALSGRDSVRFGMEGATGRPVSRKTPASESHIATMKSLATRKTTD
ncbi:MAG: hypothetical protein AB7E85_02680 [Pseudobdellovibrionaceae bacterium]